jgi:hypothetical protein
MRLVCVCSATLVLVSTGLRPTPALAQSTSMETLARARRHCLTAVAKVVGLPPGSLSVIKEQPNGSGIRVDVKVPKAIAPWACQTNAQGNVEDVHFTGSEGAL